MALYDIEFDSCLGMSHYGPVNISGRSKVELSDEEVNILITLIREKVTKDVRKLGLKTSHPDLYKKLDDAYHKLARDTEEEYWLWDGLDNGYYEYDSHELMEYCKENCGFTFEYSEEDFRNMSAELDKAHVGDDFKKSYMEMRKESPLEIDVMEGFKKWLRDYLKGLEWEERKAFFYNHLNADVCMDGAGLGYKMKIPQAIMEMAKQQN